MPSAAGTTRCQTRLRNPPFLQPQAPRQPHVVADRTPSKSTACQRRITAIPSGGPTRCLPPLSESHRKHDGESTMEPRTERAWWSAPVTMRMTSMLDVITWVPVFVGWRWIVFRYERAEEDRALLPRCRPNGVPVVL